MFSSTCPQAVAAGGVPGLLRVHVVCGDPLNLSFPNCNGDWPADMTAQLELSHPWGWSLEVAGTVNGEWLQFHLDPEPTMQIPRDACAHVRLEYAGTQPFTWLAGPVIHGGCG